MRLIRQSNRQSDRQYLDRQRYQTEYRRLEDRHTDRETHTEKHIHTEDRKTNNSTLWYSYSIEGNANNEQSMG